MPDIYGRVPQVFGGGLSADSMFMTWGADPAGGAGMMFQQLGARYSQPIRRIFEIGPMVGGAARTYYIIGRPEGMLQASRIVGPRGMACGFYQAYGSACGGGNVLNLAGQAGCAPGQGARVAWSFIGVVLNDVSMSLSAQEMTIGEALSAMFVSMTTGGDCA